MGLVPTHFSEMGLVLARYQLTQDNIYVLSVLLVEFFTIIMLC